MKKLNYYTTETFQYDDYHMIDIVSHETEYDGTVYEAWIYHRDLCMKVFMFGLIEDRESFIEIVEERAEDYLKFYKKKYEAEDPC